MSKRPLSSTSELDTTNSTMELSNLEETNSPLSKKERRKQRKAALSKKQRKMDEYIENPKSDRDTEDDGLWSKLDEINEKLSNMLTREDKNFIKNIIKTTLEEMEETILSGVTKRIEILESDIHERSVETEDLRKEIASKNSEIEKLQNVNKELTSKLEKEEMLRERDINNLEQYGRRNNIRITGIAKDRERQDSDSVAREVVKALNDKTGLGIVEGDIDIAHRLGRYTRGKNRSVIVRFVRRQTKINTMKQSKDLRTSKIYVNEDLTWLNRQVLSSLRLKDADRVEKCWSLDGKLYCIFKGHDRPVEIQYKDYKTWLNKPWPGRR